MLAGDRVALRGWAGGAGPMVARARWAGGPWHTLAAGLARSDLQHALPPGDVARGFAGFVPLPESASGPQRIEVEATVEGHPTQHWVREIGAEAEARVHGRWLAGLQPPALPPPAAPWLTWYVRGEEGALASTLEALEALEKAGAGHCRALPLAAAAGQAPTTPWFGLLEAGDRLDPASLCALAACLAKRDDTDAVYADHVDAVSGTLVLKPGPSPLLAEEPLLWDRGWLLRTAVHGATPASCSPMPQPAHACWSARPRVYATCPGRSPSRLALGRLRRGPSPAPPRPHRCRSSYRRGCPTCPCSSAAWRACSAPPRVP